MAKPFMPKGPGDPSPAVLPNNPATPPDLDPPYPAPGDPDVSKPDDAEAAGAPDASKSSGASSDDPKKANTEIHVYTKSKKWTNRYDSGDYTIEITITWTCTCTVTVNPNSPPPVTEYKIEWSRDSKVTKREKKEEKEIKESGGSPAMGMVSPLPLTPGSPTTATVVAAPMSGAASAVDVTPALGLSPAPGPATVGSTFLVPVVTRVGVEPATHNAALVPALAPQFALSPVSLLPTEEAQPPMMQLPNPTRSATVPERPPDPLTSSASQKRSQDIL